MKGFSQSDNKAQDKEGRTQKEALKSFFPTELTGTFHHGAILPHRSEVSEVVKGHAQGVELSFKQARFGNKKWEQDYKYPKVGISGLAMNLGNKQQLGVGLGFFPFIELPISERKISWKVKIGYGLGYIQKPFNGESNFKNVAIGSHFNALIYANSLLELKLVNRLHTSFGVSLIHYSNGSYARPNLGINIFSLATGLSYSLGSEKPIISTKHVKRARVWSKQITLGFGLKEIPPVDGPKYSVSTLSFTLKKIRSEKSSFGVGADLFYNSSLSDLITADSSLVAGNLANFRLGLMGMYSFDFGKVSVSFGVGTYLLSRYEGNGKLYNKLETRYQIHKNLFLRVAMKTHVVVADFVEYGVGYQF
jgi:hypothetical protein